MFLCLYVCFILHYTILLILCSRIALCEVLRMYINGFVPYKCHFHWLIEIKCKLLLVYVFIPVPINRAIDASAVQFPFKSAEFTLNSKTTFKT